MEEKDRYLTWEFLLTFLLLFLAILIVGESLGEYRLYSILGIIFGFHFSWFKRNKQIHLVRYLININIIGIFLWLIYSLLNSSFSYKEVILIFIKRGILLEIILSFNCFYPSALSYIQLLSLPLFMCSPIVIKDYSTIQLILVLLYLICWIVIIRVRFYAFPKLERQRKLIWPYSFLLPATFFLIVTFLSLFFSSYLTLGKLRGGGIFPFEGKGLQVKKGISEEEYYDLQSKIQEEISKLIPKLESREDRQKILYLLVILTKKSPDTLEVKIAQKGLLDFLRRKGPGLEKGEIENLVILIKKYLDKKTIFIMKRIKEDMADILKKNNFSLHQRISFFNQVNKMQYSSSYQQNVEYERKLQEVIDKTAMDIKTKGDLKQVVKQFKEWKDYEIYLRQEDSQEDSLRKETGPLEEESKKGSIEISRTETPMLLEKPELVSIKFLPQKTRLSMKERLDLKAQGYFSDAREKDITSLVSWKVNNPRIINIEGSKVKPLRIGSTQVYAEYLGIKSLPINIKVTIPKIWLIFSVIFIICFLILGIFVILYFLRENEKNKLKLLLDKNPRKFIIGLYENVKKIMVIFGLGYPEFIPPLSYAKLVENRYSIEDNLFLRFTVKFEEAKYSQHILHFHNAFIFLSDYNNFLEILFSRHNKSTLFLKYCLILLHRKPLFIV